MNKITINFKADEQSLSINKKQKVASNTVNYIEAIFDLGENWTGYDSVRAVWTSYFDTISTVLDNEGKCVVPQEMLKRTQNVYVNLVGSIANGNEIIDRLTTYPIIAVEIDADALVEGTETTPVTPNQFEQYIEIVRQLVGTVKDIDNIVLNDDYTLTINYSDGTSYTTTSIRGEQGEVGATPNITIGSVITLAPTEDATVTITGTTENPVLNFGIPKGEKGDNGEVTLATLESLMPTDTANGSIASFPDGQSVFPLKSCVVQINPIQDTSGGDPSPSNICPISGWNSVEVVVEGKNLFDKNSITFANGVIANDGTINPLSGYKYSVEYIKVNPSTAYAFSGTIVSNSTYNTVAFYDKDKNFLSRYTPAVGVPAKFTTPNNCECLRFNVSSTTLDVNTVMLERGSTATTYEAYNGTTHTTTLPSTVYGGTLDVVSGVLTVDHLYMTLKGSDDEGWGMPATSYFALPLTNLVNDNNKKTVICDQFNGLSWAVLTGQNRDVAVGVVNGATIRFHYSAITTLANWKTWLGNNNINICYELATPQTIQLTASQINTLKGTNNIFADSGDVSVEYVADIQGYIDKQ